MDLFSASDRVQFFQHGSIRCAIWLGDFGQINGYAQCPIEHPFYGRMRDDNEVQAALGLVHGSVTYAGDGSHFSTGRDEWWFGFDTMHAFDWNPFLEEIREAFRREMRRIYGDEDHESLDLPVRTADYVIRETQKMASALALCDEVSVGVAACIRHDVLELLEGIRKKLTQDNPSSI